MANVVKPGFAAESISAPGSSRSPGLAWALLPHLAFLVMTVMTWKRWILPFQDSGREMLTPARLAAGEMLYRDVGSPYGPLPAYLDSFALRLFGRDLDVLIALRLVVSCLGVEALRRLACRLVSEARAGAAITAFVAVACLFGNGGNWPFPYSVAALEGTVGCWWALELALSSVGLRQALLAAVVAGLAAGTKLEMLPAAVLSVAAPLFLLRRLRDALVASTVTVFIGSAAFVGPVLAVGVSQMHSYGFLVAFPVPQAWRDMYRSGVLFAGTTPHEFFRGGFLGAWLPSLAFFGATLALCSISVGVLPRIAALSALLALALPRLHDNVDVAALVPLAIALVAVEAVRLWRERSAPDPESVARFCIALVALPAVSRQPFFLRNMIYGAFSAPLALAVSLAFLTRLVRFRTSFVLVLAALTGSHAIGKWQEVRSRTVVWVDVPGARLYLPAQEARLVRLCVDVIRRETAPDDYVAAFPDPGILLFSTGRRAPFVDDVFYPGLQDASAEDQMIRRLGERRIPLIFMTNREYGEYGRARYGSGVLDRFFAEVGRRYEPAEVLGAKPTERFRERHATQAVVLRLRSGTSPVP